jgi:hypothetical protein
MKTPTRTIVILLLVAIGALVTFRTIAQSTTDLSAKTDTQFVLRITKLTETINPDTFKAKLEHADPHGSHGTKMKFKYKDKPDDEWPAKEVGGAQDTSGGKTVATVHVTQTVYATTAADLQDVASQLKD